MSFKAGIISGVAATIVCNPLDIIRLNVQAYNKNTVDVVKSIHKRGIFSFYQGVSIGIITIPSFWGIYFPTNEYLKKYNIPVSSYIACNIASTFTSPLWYIKQKYQCFNHFSIIDELKHGRISQLYSGLLTTYLINSNFIVQIPTYEYLKTKCENNTFNIFLVTSFSKTIATLVTYPLENVRVLSRKHPYMNYLSIMNLIKTNNLYYVGITNYLLRSLPYHTTIFCTYEYFRKTYDN